MSVIPATQERETERITVWEQLRKKKVSQILNSTKSGVVLPACGPNYEGGIGRRIMVQGQPQTQIGEPVWKITKAKRRSIRDVAQMLECVPNKHESLSSNPTNATKRSLSGIFIACVKTSYSFLQVSKCHMQFTHFSLLRLTSREFQSKFHFTVSWITSNLLVNSSC
jgi:hypothetical protein